MTNTFYVTYNKNEEIEQSTALRLQTLATLYSTTVFLPDRYRSNELKPSTRERIEKSDWFVVFSTKSLSKPVINELNIALEHNKKILIIYNKKDKRKLNFQNKAGVIEYELEPSTPIEQITSGIMDKINKNNTQSTDKNSNNQAMWIILGLGLALFILWVLNKNDKKSSKSRGKI